MKNYFCLPAIFCLILNIAHPIQSSDCNKKPCERQINLDDASKQRLQVCLAKQVMQDNKNPKGVSVHLGGLYEIDEPGTLEQYKVYFCVCSIEPGIKDGQPAFFLHEPRGKEGFFSAQLLERIGVTIPKQ